jgi:hypothetical protein
VKVQRDLLYLFLCHLEWASRRDLEAYKEIVAALDDQNLEIRHVAELLLHPASPRLTQRPSSLAEGSGRPSCWIRKTCKERKEK